MHSSWQRVTHEKLYSALPQNQCQHGTLSGRGRDFIFCVCSIGQFAWEELEGGSDNSQRSGEGEVGGGGGDENG